MKSAIWYTFATILCVLFIFIVADTYSHNYEISVTEPTKNFTVKEVREENGVYFVTLQGITFEKSVTLKRNTPWKVGVGNNVGATWNCFFQRYELTIPHQIVTDDDDDDWLWMSNILNFPLD